MTVRQRFALSALLYGLVAIGFTWPLILNPLDTHVSRHFDIYSVYWLVSAAPTLDGQLWTQLSAWPDGQQLGRPDSVLLLLFAAVWGKVIGARALVAALTLLGPVVSALAAEHLSRRHLGALWPWSLLAGLTYGFSGIAATALLEGHVYTLFNPWLPLLAGAMLAATGPEARIRDGLYAGLWWVLALLTTGYSGLCATILVMGLATWRFRSLLRPPTAAAAAIAVPSGLCYAMIFASGGDAVHTDSALSAGSTRLVMEQGSARLGTLAGWHPHVDAWMHSIAPTIGFTALALCLFAPIVLKRGRQEGSPHRVLLVLAFTATAISLGPTLDLFDQDLQFPWILWPLLAWEEGASFLHFPARLMWLGSLCFGAVAAVVATRLVERRPGAGAVLLAMAAVDALVVTGAPFRTQARQISTPSAYAEAPEQGAILELLPPFYGHAADLELYFNNLGCARQMDHGRPLLNQCIGTTLHTGPRWETTQWMTGALFEGRVGVVESALAHQGIAAVAFFPDLFSRPDREVLKAGLEAALGAPIAASTDAGSHVVLYRVRSGG